MNKLMMDGRTDGWTHYHDVREAKIEEAFFLEERAYYQNAFCTIQSIPGGDTPVFSLDQNDAFAYDIIARASA